MEYSKVIIFFITKASNTRLIRLSHRNSQGVEVDSAVGNLFISLALPRGNLEGSWCHTAATSGILRVKDRCHHV